jgi:hypothetical protein
MANLRIHNEVAMDQKYSVWFTGEERAICEATSKLVGIDALEPRAITSDGQHP